MTNKILSVFSVLTALSQAVAGMNVSTSGNCSGYGNMLQDFKRIPYYNTTGTTNFTMKELTGNDDPWYYYLTMRAPKNDTRFEDGMVDRWLGVPRAFVDTDRGNATRICMATTLGKKKSLKHATGNSTCEGVLSKKCEKLFKESPMDEKGCPKLSRETIDECDIGSDTSTILSPADNCFLTSIPGLNIPKGIVVVPFLGIGFGSADGDKSPEAAYDRVTHEAIATFFTVADEGDQSTGDFQGSKIGTSVCAIPNVVHQGSRSLSAGTQLQLSAFAVAVAAVALLNTAL